MKENSMPDTDIFFDSIKRAYFLFSRQIDGSITSVSSSITSMLGYDRHEFMKLFADSFLQDPIQNKKYPAEYEMQVNHKNGSPRWLKIVEMPVLNQAG